MKLTLSLIALFSAAAAAADHCPTTYQPRTADEILRVERGWAQSLAQGDIHAVDCLLAPDFSGVTAHGTVLTKADVLSRMTAKPSSPVEVRDLAVRLEGGVAIVTGISGGSDGHGDPAAWGSRFTDIFIWRARRWVAIIAQQTKIADARLHVSGEPVGERAP